MNNFTSIGITSPKFHLGWNTDLRIQNFFVRPGISSKLAFAFCGGKRFSARQAASKFLSKFDCSFPLPDLQSYDVDDYDYFYCYGSVPKAIEYRLSRGEAYAVHTTGAMSPHYLAGHSVNVSPSALILEKDRSVPAAVPFHFHTEYGRLQHEAIAISGRKVVSIPFFLPYLDLYKPVQRDNELNIAFIGRDGKRKGLFLLLEALKLIPESVLSAARLRLTVISASRPEPIPGIELSWYKYASRRTVRRILCESHILAMPALLESYGIIYIEAMAAGCLIIADNDYPRLEILSGAGMHVENQSAECLARSLRLVIHNRDLIGSYGQAGRTRYLDCYSPRVVSQMYEQLFLSILQC